MVTLGAAPNADVGMVRIAKQWEIIMKMSVLVAAVVLACSCIVGVAFQTTSWSYASHSRKQLKVKPLHENFFLDVAEDPAVNTPKQV